MTISRIFLYDGPTGNTKAFVDLQTAEGIILKGFKLILGPTGLFVGAPSEKGKDGKWRESIVIPKDLRDEVNRMVVGEYDKLRLSSPALVQHEEEEQGLNDLPF